MMKFLLRLILLALVTSELILGQKQSKDSLAHGDDPSAPNSQGIGIPGDLPNLPDIDAILKLIEIFSYMKDINWVDIGNKIVDFSGRLDSPCGVLNATALVINSLFGIYNEFTFTNLSPLPILIDGGHVFDITLDTELTVSIDKVIFDSDNCLFTPDNGGLFNRDDKLVGLLSVDSARATLSNYNANGTIGDSIQIDSTGNARILLENFVLTFSSELEDNIYGIYLINEFDMHMSAGYSFVKFVADGDGNHDLETYINEYLSMHFNDIMRFVEAYVNMEGKVHDDVIDALNIVTKAMSVIIKLSVNNMLCGTIYERVGCFDVLDGLFDPKQIDKVELSDFGRCLSKLLEDLGPIDYIKFFINSGIFDIIMGNDNI